MFHQIEASVIEEHSKSNFLSIYSDAQSRNIIKNFLGLQYHPTIIGS